MKTTLVMICVPRSVLPHDAKSGFPLLRETLHGAHIWAAMFIASAASSNSASVVYRPKQIRTDTSPSASERPSTRRKWLGRPEERRAGTECVSHDWYRGWSSS